MSNCECGSQGERFSCCEKKEFVQDKLCCEWEFPAGTTPGAGTVQTIYQKNGNICNIVASGTIKFCGPAGSTVAVDFRRGGDTPLGGVVVEQFVLNENSCVTFTVSKFDRIVIGVLNTAPVSPIEGELSYTTNILELPH